MTDAEQKVYERLIRMGTKLSKHDPNAPPPHDPVPFEHICGALLEAAALLLERNAPSHIVTRTYTRDGWTDK